MLDNDYEYYELDKISEKNLYTLSGQGAEFHSTKVFIPL
jgi:hypothetical protein